MSGSTRVAVLVLVVGLGMAGDSSGLAARRGKRDFPTFSKCPVHKGTVDGSDPFVFTASRPSAVLTFLTCDDRAFGGGEAYLNRIDVSIDDLIVVDIDVFNANRLAYPGEVPEDYRIERSTEACYSDANPVTSVFRRDVALARSRVLPLYERFEGAPRGWALVNASFALEDRDTLYDPESQSSSLILARQERPTEPSNLCSMASVQLSGLVKDRQYVVDFSWFAAGFTEEGQDILTVVIDDQFGMSTSWVTNSRRPPSSDKGASPERTRR